jgi:glutamate synthase domain-containing protein 3
MQLIVNDMDYTKMNTLIKESADKDIILDNVLGQRYIGCGLSDKNITVNGTSGNAMGAYMNGANVTVFGNAQDATGDTMNNGKIVIHGNCGDTTAYGMRGGEIFIKGNAGYRVGIHMKQYKEMRPVIIVGGKSGDFLGEYLAGGIIIVLGIGFEDTIPVGSFCGTGMHGGAIFIRSDKVPADLPSQVNVTEPTEEDTKLLHSYINEYSKLFNEDAAKLSNSKFIKLSANTKNPYKQLYTHN